MSQKLGEELDKLFENKDYVIGIHRTGYNYMSEEMINSIFNKGLINNGHIMQGGMAGNFDIEKTVSIFNDFTVLNGQLKAAHGYKGSQGCIIVKIPKSYLVLMISFSTETKKCPEPTAGSHIRRESTNALALT